MKKNNLAISSCLAFLLASTALSQAQTTIVDWDFDGLGTQAAPYNSPAPSYGAGTAIVLGMTNDYNDGTIPSFAYADVTSTAGASTGSGSYAWRIRGGNPAPGEGAGSPNGWSTNAPIATQGAEFVSSTAGYDDIQVTFDLYTTSAAEANVAFIYSINGGITWVTNLVMTYTGAMSASSQNNTTSPLTVPGPYLQLSQSGGGWYNAITVNLSSISGVNNNPEFAFEIVNASTSTDCINQTGGAYNNNSGNWRYDNIIVSGSANGSLATPPTIFPSSTATVDGPFTNTFADDATWRHDITAISVNGTALPTSAYSVSAGQIVFTPSASSLLEKAGTVNIVVTAANYSADLVTQVIAPGVPKSMALTSQPQGPTGNGGTFVLQPKLTIYDQYLNLSTNCSATYTATPSAGWSFGSGSGVAVLLANGVAAFTNLSAVSSAAVSGATINLTASGTSGLGGLPYTSTNTAAFNIPAPNASGFTVGNVVVEQEDNASANSTFSMVELSPAIANQTPVNIYPVPATGTNGLRQSSSGSTGRLATSQDGTLLCFTAGLCSDSTVSDETALNSRGCGTFNSLGQYVLQTTYVGYGGSVANQARSASTIDDATFWMGDKGGVYTNNETTNNSYIGYTPQNEVNVRTIRCCNGTVFVLQQSGASDLQATVMAEVPPPADNAQYLTELVGFPIDLYVDDFYAVASGANGTNIDTIFYIDATNATEGGIFKYTNSFTINADDEEIWASTGSSWPTPNGGDGLCAATNANGGFDLYYTTGKGGTTHNSVVHLYDSAPWNLPINVTQTNVLFTSPTQATLKGLAFAPIPILGPLSNIKPSNSGLSFTFTSPAANLVNTNFTVWGTTNLLMPVSQWNNLGHPTQLGNTTYGFTDSSAGGKPQEFYRVTSP